MHAAGAQQDALDATITQTAFALAFALGGVVFRGACAYLCYIAVGRWRVRIPEVVNGEREIAQVQEEPDRLILSPFYTVGRDFGGGSETQGKLARKRKRKGRRAEGRACPR